MFKTRNGVSPVVKMILGEVDVNKIEARHFGGCFVEAVDASHTGKNEFGEKTVPLGNSFFDFVDDEEIHFNDPLRPNFIESDDVADDGTISCFEDVGHADENEAGYDFEDLQLERALLRGTKRPSITPSKSTYTKKSIFGTRRGDIIIRRCPVINGAYLPAL